MINTTVLPQGTVSLLYPYGSPSGFTLTASGGNPPLTWAIIGGSLPPGLTLDSATGVISGTPTSPGTSGFTVQATDSSSNTASAPLSIIINPAITNAALTGSYVFTFNGYNNGTLVLMAGSFVADGNGKITSGVLDYNDGNGESGGSNPVPQHIVAAPQSSYSVQANGLGTLTLVTDLRATYLFQVAITSNGSGRLIQSDPKQPQAYGSGAIKNTTLLPMGLQWPLCGNNVAVGLFGLDSSLTRYAAAGEFQFDPSTWVDAESGVMDINDGGTPSSATFTGAFNQYDNTSSRGITGFTFKPGGRHFYAFYLVSSRDHKQNELVLVSTDPASQPAALTLWSGLQQVSSIQFGANNWNNLALAGTGVAEISALETGHPDVTAGLFVGQGQKINTCQTGVYDTAGLTFDENDGGKCNGGSCAQAQSSTGTYCIDMRTGRVTLKNFSGQSKFAQFPPGLYMIAADKAFVVGTDPAVSSGVLEPKTATSFNNATIVGPYTGGTVTPVTTNVTNGATWLASDGNGNMNGTEDTSGPGRIVSMMPLTYTYQIDGTGRIVFTGNPAAVGYVISPAKMVLFPTTDPNPALSILMSTNHQ